MNWNKKKDLNCPMAYVLNGQAIQYWAAGASARGSGQEKKKHMWYKEKKTT
jgi:hypothetical protein